MSELYLLCKYINFDIVGSESKTTKKNINQSIKQVKLNMYQIKNNKYKHTIDTLIYMET